jgi:hypothetical protein
LAYKYLGHYGSGISCQYAAFSSRYVQKRVIQMYKKYESLKEVLIPIPEDFVLINELKHLNEQ